MCGLVSIWPGAGTVMEFVYTFDGTIIIFTDCKIKRGNGKRAFGVKFSRSKN